MKTVESYIVFVALLGLLATLVSADPAIRFHHCADETNIDCTVHEVRVRPCREAASRQPCSIKKGREASISFDFTPNFSSETLTSRAYWPQSSIDLPLVGMNTDACLATTCPTTAGVRQTYSYALPISSIFGARKYTVKWKLWNDEEKKCCFKFDIRLKD